MVAETTQPKALPQRKKRSFLGEDFVSTTWELIEPYFKNLQERELLSLDGLQQWLRDWSELDAAVSENSRWIYVRTTLDTTDETAKAELKNLYATIYPKITVAEQLLQVKFVACPFAEQLDKDLFFTTVRKIKKSLELYREENIPLNSEMNMKQSTYGQITAAQSITYNGAEITPKQAEVYLRSNDRAQREEVFKLIAERKLQDAEKLDELLSELIQLRHQIAVNSGFKNYIEFRFMELGRFDYTPDDCLQFHQSVKEVIMPLVNQQSKERKEKLGLDKLKLWDLMVDTSGKPALKPCSSTEDLIDKTIACFNQLDPYFGERIEIMKRMNYLDLGARMHKSNGGYNMSMPELGVPFIFMNSANSEQDLITMVHEGGHAIQTFLTHDLELSAFKEITSEIAEVASMGMELMSMDHWDIFYADADDLNRARKNHLNHVLTILSRICMGDSFQFWLYANPNHTVEERRKKWMELVRQFTPGNIDRTEAQDYLEIGYQNILHFYEVPFYYIEYAFAELGAIGLWKSFKLNQQKAIDDYKKGLALGFTKPIPVFYETVGAKFDFSKSYLGELVEFLQSELKKL